VYRSRISFSNDTQPYNVNEDLELSIT